jgi:hypothetical protein
VNKKESDVEQETSGEEEVRDEGITSAAAEAFCFNCGRIVRRVIVLSDAHSFWFTALCEKRARRKKHLASISSCIHDHSACSYRPGSHLLALSISNVRSLSPMRRTALPSQQRDTRGLIGFTGFERPLLRPDLLTKLKPPDDLLV